MPNMDDRVDNVSENFSEKNEKLWILKLNFNQVQLSKQTQKENSFAMVSIDFTGYNRFKKKVYGFAGIHVISKIH